MQIFYKNGFYVAGVHKIPTDSVEITEEIYKKLLDGQSSGKQIIADDKGYPILVEPQPSAFHVLKNGIWVISEEKKTALLAENKKNLINRIANIVDEVKAKMLIGYSQAEIESFYKQEQEALAYQADNSAQTPMLKQIAENRGVSFEILVQKVIEKSNLFATTIGSVIGQRQRFEDRIEAVTTQEELDIIEREITEWTKSI